MLRGAMVAVLMVAGAPALAAEPGEDRACYDAAVVGRILGASNFVGLTELYGTPDDVWLGGRYDFRIRVEVASGMSVPDRMSVQAIMTTQPVRNAAVLFFVQKLEDGRWFAIDWEWAAPDWRGRYSTRAEDEPPRCRDG
jgi:hypothetical protein